MSAEGLTSRLAALQAGLLGLRDAASGLLPPSWRAQLGSGVSIVAIDLGEETVTLRRFADGRGEDLAQIPRAAFDAESLRAALGPALARSRLLRDSFALRFPDSLALKRSLALPLAARGSLASLLALELERHSPIDAGEVFHDYRIQSIDRAGGRLNLQWRIVRRASIKPAVEICRQAGVDLAVIAFIGDDTPADGGNFPVERGATRLLRLRRNLVGALLALIVLLTGAIVAGAYMRNADAAAAFAVTVDAARAQARPALELEHRIAAARAESALLLREKRRSSVARLLAETTRLLPNGSWLTQFSYQGNEIRIRGYSNAAASLIARFDSSPLFTAAEFRSPLTQAQTPDLEQFDLAVRLKGGAR